MSYYEKEQARLLRLLAEYEAEEEDGGELLSSEESDADENVSEQDVQCDMDIKEEVEQSSDVEPEEEPDGHRNPSLFVSFTNPDVSVHKAENTYVARAIGLSRDTVIEYFALTETVLAENRLLVKPGHILNSDKTRLQLNTRAQVLSEIASKSIPAIIPAEKGESVSDIACYNAEEVYLYFYCIFKENNKTNECADGMLPGSQLCMSKKLADNALRKLQQYCLEILSGEDSSDNEFVSSNVYLSDEYKPFDSSDSEYDSRALEQNRKPYAESLVQPVPSTRKGQENTNFGDSVDETTLKWKF
ncbi:hypothetical protein RN001_006695 [Aquatica leii]|uniref:Uncharacterized protein n=1 Tax=Aquatica leii TaxID=1421715 RepID=A0AAN7PIX2_9COLE|nr:hypothetical protein RN001_006695 [Aquatica leii]